MNVERRERKDGRDDGRYSTLLGKEREGEKDGGCVENLNGKAFFVRVAARVRMAVRWGVLLPGVATVLWGDEDEENKE